MTVPEAACSLVILAGVLTLSGAGTATVAAMSGAGELSCELIETRSGGTIEISGVVRGAAGIAGDYDVAFDKTDSGGTSTVRQSGTFTIDPVGFTETATASFGLATGGRISARMTLRAGGTLEACERIATATSTGETPK